MIRLKDNEEDAPEVSLTISTQTFFRIAILVAIAALLWAGIHRAGHAVLLIFIAGFLALALNAPVYWLSKQLPGKRKGSRSLATVLSFLIVIILLGAFLASIVPPLVRQTENLIHAAPHLINDFRNQNSYIGGLIRRYHLQTQISHISNQLADRLKNSGGTAISTIQSIGSSFFSLLTILVLTFMMLVEGPRWVNFIKGILPKRHHHLTDRMITEMYGVVKGFVNGQVILAALASVLIMPAVLLLGISYPAAIMVVIFICGLIPMVGHFIGAIIVTIVALFHSTSAAVIILAYYILYQQIETYLIQPRIQANSTNMSPLLVFMSVVVGINFGGLVGGLVAIPIAGCLRIAVLEYLKTANLIDNKAFEHATNDTK